MHPEVKGNAAFTAAIERALAHGEARAVVVIHLERAGGEYTAADDALHAAAEARIARTIRPTDVLGRLGPRRVGVLTAADGADLVANRIRSRLREPFEVGGSRVKLVPQVGVGYSDAGILTAEDILRQAGDSFS